MYYSTLKIRNSDLTYVCERIGRVVFLGNNPIMYKWKYMHQYQEQNIKPGKINGFTNTIHVPKVMHLLANLQVPNLIAEGENL